MLTVLLAALAIIAATRAAASQDIAKGESIARTWCAGCHSIEASGPELGSGPPSFMSVARKPGTNKATLRIFLSTAHAKMANYALSQDEIADVSAYILSLRK
jgi:mono/diheme cytochrome c family protein